jgi:cellulose synthase/poly-beta-1,6-N-acetylglucosamine synthase-like glycosyltransferase
VKTLQVLFFVLLFIPFYAYIGYGILLGLTIALRRFSGSPGRAAREALPELAEEQLPEVTLLITAYNERDQIARKLENTRELVYPRDKLAVLWVTDGSDDGSVEILRDCADITVLHQPQRRGKVAAINRAMPQVKTPVVVFSDANTMLSPSALIRIVRLFQDPQIGCVSGEKRILQKSRENAAAAGEGLYWKYESLLKRWDAELWSVVGAAGELFAIRTALFTPVAESTLLDDFVISLTIAMQGYRIGYDPDAFAIESASANVKEELKRKIRIAAGGLQAIVRLRPLLNIFKFRLLSFQYFSHRVLRWTAAPLALLALLPVNFALALQPDGVFAVIMALQILFYLLALSGWFLEARRIRLKVLFVPYYFCMMNFAVLAGMVRYFQNKQNVLWEKALRADQHDRNNQWS